jgi:hypothetical protein
VKRGRLIGTLCVVALVAVIAGLFADPLNRFALWMSYNSIRGAWWRSGLSSIIDAPTSATPEDLLAKSFFGNDPHRILIVRHIFILSPVSCDSCLAAYVERDGKDFVYLYWKDDGHWNLREYPE